MFNNMLKLKIINYLRLKEFNKLPNDIKIESKIKTFVSRVREFVKSNFWIMYEFYNFIFYFTFKMFKCFGFCLTEEMWKELFIEL